MRWSYQPVYLIFLLPYPFIFLYLKFPGLHTTTYEQILPFFKPPFKCFLFHKIFPEPRSHSLPPVNSYRTWTKALRHLLTTFPLESVTGMHALTFHIETITALSINSKNPPKQIIVVLMKRPSGNICLTESILSLFLFSRLMVPSKDPKQEVSEKFSGSFISILFLHLLVARFHRFYILHFLGLISDPTEIIA